MSTQNDNNKIYCHNGYVPSVNNNPTFVNNVDMNYLKLAAEFLNIKNQDLVIIEEDFLKISKVFKAIIQFNLCNIETKDKLIKLLPFIKELEKVNFDKYIGLLNYLKNKIKVNNFNENPNINNISKENPNMEMDSYNITIEDTEQPIDSNNNHNKIITNSIKLNNNNNTIKDIEIKLDEDEKNEEKNDNKKIRRSWNLNKELRFNQKQTRFRTVGIILKFNNFMFNKEILYKKLVLEKKEIVKHYLIVQEGKTFYVFLLFKKSIDFGINSRDELKNFNIDNTERPLITSSTNITPLYRYIINDPYYETDMELDEAIMTKIKKKGIYTQHENNLVLPEDGFKEKFYSIYP